MQNNLLKSQSGFSLVEILVASAIGSSMVLLIGQAFQMLKRSEVSMESRLEATTELQLMKRMIQRDYESRYRPHYGDTVPAAALVSTGVVVPNFSQCHGLEVVRRHSDSTLERVSYRTVCISKQESDPNPIVVSEICGRDAFAAVRVERNRNLFDPESPLDVSFFPKQAGPDREAAVCFEPKVDSIYSGNVVEYSALLATSYQPAKGKNIRLPITDFLALAVNDRPNGVELRP